MIFLKTDLRVGLCTKQQGQYNSSGLKFALLQVRLPCSNSLEVVDHVEHGHHTEQRPGQSPSGFLLNFFCDQHVHSRCQMRTHTSIVKGTLPVANTTSAKFPTGSLQELIEPSWSSVYDIAALISALHGESADNNGRRLTKFSSVASSKAPVAGVLFIIGFVVWSGSTISE